MIQLDNIRFAYDKEVILKGIGFTIEEGEIVGILGLSGSGKTTLLKILSGLIMPDEGTYLIDGLQAFDKKRKTDKIASELGVVFQQFNLFPHMTVLDNLAMPLRLRTKKSKQACIATAVELLDILGLKDQIAKYPYQCSGGQQQRIAIARALILDPKVLLIDEPTSSLDKENVKKVEDLLKSLHQRGLTLILITHDLPFAQAMCNRVIELSDGNLVFDGPADTYFVN
ncbi:MAG: amino acid ABC transporter ATP-binding protein [Erysipelotrichales bacterium]|nr:MAG: amino acid ABC transporter ATP-binding protein [Erysipelotrichales bacterium]